MRRGSDGEQTVLKREDFTDEAVPVAVKMEYYGGCLLQATFALALLPALHANVINYRLMIPTRTRNYSLKTLKPDRRDEGAREERAKEELLRTKAKLLPTIAENR